MLAALLVGACNVDLEATLTRLMEAQRLVADMRVQLHRSTEAAQRAVMADSDEISTEFARESESATRALQDDVTAIVPILRALDYRDDGRLVDEFERRFAELAELDRSLLALAVENSNVKAERLSFGPGREAADGLRDRLQTVFRSAPGAPRVELLALRTELAVREVQALQAPHIDEGDDAEMTRLEERMDASLQKAQTSLEELSRLPDAGPADALAAAREQLERFASVNRELVKLSRKNTNVRSLAVSLGNKRRLTAACDETLIALQDALAKHRLQPGR